MAFTSSQVLDLVLTDAYQKGFSVSETWAEKACTIMPVSGHDLLVGWLDKIPSVRQWEGNRKFHTPRLRTYSIGMRRFELSEQVDRTAVDDNQLALYTNMFEAIGTQTKKYKDRLMGEYIRTNAVCADGMPFFSASHPIDLDNPGSGTYGNLASGLTLQAALTDAVNVAAQMKGADGEYIGFEPTHLLIEKGKKIAANEVLNNTFIPSAAGTATQNNPLQGFVEPIFANELKLNSVQQAALDASLGRAGGYYAYLLDLSKGISPFVFGERDVPEFQNLGTLGAYDPNTDMYKYGSRMRGGEGFSLPFLAVRMTVG